MKVIQEEPWSYVLFDNGKEWIVTFMLGGAAMVDVSVRLTTDEIARVKGDASYIKRLVAEMKRDERVFDGREIRPSVWPKDA